MRQRETVSRSIYKAKSWSKLAWTTLEHLIKFELHIWAEQCHEATTTITSLILLSVSASHLEHRAYNPRRPESGSCVSL